MRRTVRGGGGQVTLKGLVTVTKGGQAYSYLRSRRGGKTTLIPLPALPHDHPEFLAAYAEARRQLEAGQKRRAPAPATLAALTDWARRSERYAGRSKVYRATLARHFDDLDRTVGAAPWAGIRPEHIRKNVTEASSPQDRLKAWRFLFALAVDAGKATTDPSQAVTAPKRPRSDGHPPWTADEVDAYRARWPIGTVPRAAFELLFWVGCRIGDAVRLGPGMVGRDGVLSFHQNKTGGLAYVPWTCALPDYAASLAPDRDMMHQALAARNTRHMTWLATYQGRTRSEKALGTLIRESAHAAEIQKSAHGLRKARAVALADAGATTHQIGAWTGHESLKEIEHYTLEANRRRAVMGRPLHDNERKSN